MTTRCVHSMLTHEESCGTMKGTSCVVFVGNPDELPKLPATMRSKAIPSVQGAPLCDER